MPPIVRRDGPSDKTILRRARQGDRQAFLALLHRYDPRLRRLALRLLADPKRLDRVLSRAYLKAWRSLPFLKRSEPAARWLYRVVYNTCLNELRWEPSRAAPTPPDGPPVPLPAAPVERRLMALRALTPAERISLVLVDGEGLSLDAAARMMRRETTEVAANLVRARGRWRAFVTGEPEPLPEPDPPEPAERARRSDGTPPIAPSPAATLAKLAALAAPTAPREPGGHVKLLATSAGESKPPAVAAKRPRGRSLDAEPPPVRADESDERDGAEPAPRPRSRRGAKTARVAREAAATYRPAPDGAVEPPVAADVAAEIVGDGDGPAAKPEYGPAAGLGAGARRKRRRDAKRAVRTRSRGGTASGAANPGRGGTASGAANPSREGTASGAANPSRDTRRSRDERDLG